MSPDGARLLPSEAITKMTCETRRDVDQLAITRMDVDAAQRLVVTVGGEHSHEVVRVVAIPDHNKAIEAWVVDAIRVAMREHPDVAGFDPVGDGQQLSIAGRKPHSQVSLPAGDS